MGELLGKRSGRIYEGEDPAFLTKTFGSYLALTILVGVVSNLVTFIGTALTGAALGADALAAVGLASTMRTLLRAFGNCVGMGAAILLAQACGKREDSRANDIFNAASWASLVGGVVFSVACFVFSDPISTLLGAKEGAIHQMTADYIRAMSWMTIPYAFFRVLSSCMRIEGVMRLGVVAAFAMGASDLAFTALSLYCWNLGVFGVGLAKTLSKTMAAVVCCAYFVMPKRHFKLTSPRIRVGLLKQVMVAGTPDTVTSFSAAFCSFVLNLLLMMMAGAPAVAAFSVFNTTQALISAVSDATAENSTMYFSVFYGEEDREAMGVTWWISMWLGLVIAVVVGLPFLLFAEQVVHFCGIADGPVFHMGVAAVRFAVLGIPFGHILDIIGAFYRSVGLVWASNAANFTTLAGTRIACGAIMTFLFGPMGMWASFVVALALSDILLWGTATMVRRRRDEKPDSALESFVVYPAGFATSVAASISIGGIGSGDVPSKLSQTIGDWCEEQGVDERRGYLVSLAVEEVARNVAEHGVADPGSAKVEVKLVRHDDGSLLLRIRDNGHAFNPLDYDVRQADSSGCIGIKLLRKMMKNLDYQYILDTNNTLVSL